MAANSGVVMVMVPGMNAKRGFGYFVVDYSAFL
jgi:hypothetical protein